MTRTFIFTYGSKKYVQLTLCVLLLGMFGIIFTTGKMREEDWPLATIFWAILATGCALSLSIFLDVVVSDDGVSKPFYGLRGRHLSWSAIERASCYVRDDGGIAYSIKPAKRPLLRSIYFTSSIENIAQLVDVLNDELIRRNIPIYEGPGDSRVRVERLRHP